MDEFIAGNSSKNTSLDLVVGETVNTLENGQNQLFTMAENARSECARVSGALSDIKRQLVDIRTAQAESGENKEWLKKQLEDKKLELETSLINLQETADKAENLVYHVGVVIDFIRGNQDISIKLESFQQKQQLGLQIIKAQEEERKRVAREIHDGPAQSMANVVLRMEFCEKLMDVNPEKVRGELQELKDIVRNNLQDVRKIIFDLRPMAIDDLGVMPTLKRYIEDFRGKNDIDIGMNFFGKETRLEPVLEIALFRLVQEALNNVVKHARAAKVLVTLEMMPEWVKVSVEDDGVGFILERVMTDYGTRFGLISMQERADLLGGTLQINTAPGQGTRVVFKVPVAG